MKKVPYELWMGHVPRAHQAVKDLKVPDLTARQKTLESIREEAALAMQYMQESWVKPTNYKLYQKGDRVWLEGTNLHTTHPTRKLGPKRYGPFEVREVVGHINFCLELPSHWKIHDVFHAKLLHPYKETKEYGLHRTPTRSHRWRARMGGRTNPGHKDAAIRKAISGMLENVFKCL